MAKSVAYSIQPLMPFVRLPPANPNWGSLRFWQPPILSAPIVNVPGLDDVKPVTLSALTVDAKISGFLAKTTVFMSFFNPHDRVLEGELEFALPENATVSGYGYGLLMAAAVHPVYRGADVSFSSAKRGIHFNHSVLHNQLLFRHI